MHRLARRTNGSAELLRTRTLKFCAGQELLVAHDRIPLDQYASPIEAILEYVRHRAALAIIRSELDKCPGLPAGSPA